MENLNYLGIDGEGQTINGKHRYILLAVSNKDRTFTRYVENLNGLSTEECLEFICSLPKGCKLFAYAFGYDLTKILEGMDNKGIYLLFHPEERQSEKSPRVRYVSYPSYMNAKFKVALLATRLTVKKKRGSTYGPRYIIHDIFKFFQGKFTNAVKDWKIGTSHVISHMEEMKLKRKDFDKESPEAVRQYCFDECAYMAELAEKLTLAHITAEIPLMDYFGAGSSASAMLSVMGIKEIMKDVNKIHYSKEMMNAVMCAFFGGRFENSIAGRVKRPIHSWDISSAYPYQIYQLPCLLHGKWSKTKSYNRMIRSRIALVHYKKLKSRSTVSWGPFPFRFYDNTISFPDSCQGWVWKNEYLQGEQHFENVYFIEAYVFDSDCECTPFEKIPHYYLERCRIGKEGPGIVLKLGCNSCYGKLAQSVGGRNGAFTNWIYAGLITSGCRAQLLELMGLHKNKENILMVATDGLSSLEKIDAPIPQPTGTDSSGKPLGGWEYKYNPDGVFAIRPGIHFSLGNNDKDTRARGLGRHILFDKKNEIVEAFESGSLLYVMGDIVRFCGAKSSVRAIPVGDCWEYRRSEKYGEWIKWPIQVSFSPLPKRQESFSTSQGWNILTVRNFFDTESFPYAKGLKTEDDPIAKGLRDIIEEQPDLQLEDTYGEED